MLDVLKNMDVEKRDRIINAAITEFASYPFDKASTNEIVKNAGISKGLIFHYFGSKEGLYEHVTGFVLKKLFDEINENVKYEESDIFDRIKQIVIMKAKLSLKYPQLFDFIFMMISNETDKIDTKSILKVYAKYGVNAQELLGKVYSYNIDYSLFKEGQDIASSINIIRWTLEKYSEEYIGSIGNDLSSMDFDKINEDLDMYTIVLKKAFYKTNN